VADRIQLSVREPAQGRFVPLVRIQPVMYGQFCRDKPRALQTTVNSRSRSGYWSEIIASLNLRAIVLSPISRKSHHGRLQGFA
jgi:hypothetical protein